MSLTFPPLTCLPCNGKYKTKLCIHFAETRTCFYGAKCHYAHGRGELRIAPGRNGDSPPVHPRHKTTLCKNQFLYSSCQFGARCMFIHREDPEYAELHQRMRQRQAMLQTARFASSPPRQARQQRVAASSPARSTAPSLPPAALAIASPPTAAAAPSAGSSAAALPSRASVPAVVASLRVHGLFANKQVKRMRDSQQHIPFTPGTPVVRRTEQPTVWAASSTPRCGGVPAIWEQQLTKRTVHGRRQRGRAATSCSGEDMHCQ